MTTKTDSSDIPMNKPILLFDGLCNLCNNAVKLMIKWDKKGILRLASLQSDIGQILLKKNNLQEKKMDSIVLVDKEIVYLRSDVPLEIMRKIGGIWQLFYVFKIVPRFIRDTVYDWIARHRYQWFGKQKTCMIPTKEIRKRFLEDF